MYKFIFKKEWQYAMRVEDGTGCQWWFLFDNPVTSIKRTMRNDREFVDFNQRAGGRYVRIDHVYVFPNVPIGTLLKRQKDDTWKIVKTA